MFLTLKNKITKLSPEELLKQAQSLQNAGLLHEATVAFERLKSLYPKFPPILNDLGILYLRQGKFNEGRQLLEKSLQLDSKQPMTLLNLGQAYQHQAKFTEAINIYKRIAKVQPQFLEAQFNQGVCLHYLERFKEAIECFDIVISLQPNSLDARNAKGISLFHAGHHQDALAVLNETLPLNQKFPEIYNNLGLTLHKLNRFEEALENYSKAISIKPEYADAYSNRALTYQAMQRTEDALVDFDRCISIDSNHTDAHWNRALVYLLRGEYQKGWTDYEWRWRSYSRKWVRAFNKPTWLGQFPIQDKTIFIYPEQGFGDFIQFCRYIPVLSEMGAKVILEVPAPLKRLAKTLKGNIKLVDSGHKNLIFDIQCPIMSLPLACKTTLETIPTKLPYLFAEQEKVDNWNNELGERKRPRVGLAWSGAKGQANDHNRSMKLKQLAPLLNLPFEFHSLQKEVREEDEAFLSASTIFDHRSSIQDFSDTAALVENMDFVISVDTSIAHLSGALNKKLFVLLAFNADYRWLLNQQDYPWYPSALLLRQEQIGDWDKPMKELTQKINSITLES